MIDIELRMRLPLRLPLGIGLGLLATAFSADAQTPKSGDRPTIAFTVSDQLIYDDNLYRLPDEILDLGSSIGPQARREDYINRLSVGFNGELQIARQAVSLSLQADDNRFEQNDNLDYISSKNRLRWNWVLGDRLAGTLGGEYSRSLASFAYNPSFERDILEGEAYYGEVNYRVGNNWRLKVTGRRQDVSHSLAARRFDNSSADIATGGIEYQTSSRNILGWDYRYVDGRFPEDFVAFPSQRSVREYIERGALGRIKYALGAKTSFDGSAGYLRREYPQDSTSNFSGKVWRADLHWTPSAKIQWSLSGWHELRSHQDAESDYFISRGLGAEVTWSMRETLELSIEASSERQQYLLAVGIAGADTRRDVAERAQSVLTYKPRDWLALNASFGVERRDSNRTFFTYDDWIAGVGVRTLF